MNIAQKGLVILAVPLVYQAALLGVLVSQQRANREAQERATHTKAVLAEVDRLSEDVISVQNESRGFVFFREAHLDPDLGAAARDLPLSVDRLRRLTRDHPGQTRRLDAIQPHTDDLVEWFNQVSRAAREARWDGAGELIRTRRGLNAATAIRDQLREIRATEQELDVRRTARLQEINQRQTNVLIAGFAINVVLGLGAMLLFGRSVGRRFGALQESVRRVRSGEDLPTPLRGFDELAELDRSFHRMAREVAEARAQERMTQKAIEAQNRELVSVNRELDLKRRENEMFVYSVSHDLRSPLVNLQGFSKELGMTRDDLKALLAQPLDDAQRSRALGIIDRDVTESIQYIQTAVSRLARIIDALLTLSRAGRVEYRPEVVEMAPLIDRILVAMRNTLQQRRARVDVLPLPAAWGDRTALDQIFANLIGNAVNYLDPQRPGQIEVGVLAPAPDAPADATIYYVKDNGLGIPEAYLPKLFAAFQRLHGDLAPGEGIGLVLVRRAVERHGGRIWVESREGVGTTFFVALPHRPEEPTAGPMPAAEKVTNAPATFSA